MDWATAAAIVSDQTPDLSDPPDAPGADIEFWQAVRQLVSSGDLQESIWTELEHPRGRAGRWIDTSLHEGEHFRALRVALPDELPQSITVGGLHYERHPDPHVTVFDSRRAKQSLPEGDHGELMKQMAKTVSESSVSVGNVKPPWHIAEKADRRSLVVSAHVAGIGPLYKKLSEQAGHEIPPPPTHVTAYTAPGKKGIGLGTSEEWHELTRPPTADERAALYNQVDLVEAELQEATIYTEALHPRDRLGRWLEKAFGEQLAKPADKKGRTPTPYRAARWVDTGQDFPTMAHEAARLTHPDGSPEEHAAIAQAVLADRPPPKDVSQEAKAAAKLLRSKSTPEGLWGKYIYRLHGIAAAAHADQTDHKGVPYVRHVEAVADSVTDEAKPVALFHDALEDTQLTPEMLKATLIEPKVTTPEQAQTIVDAIGLLSRDDSTKYEQYVKDLANAPGKAGELAREVKRADLLHNLGRMTPEIEAKKPNLRPRYEAALKTLAPERKPITQRGEPKNVNNLDEATVMARLEKLYQSSVDSGAAEVELHWYQTAHDDIWKLAEENDIEPHTLAAMVAATSPQLTWRHEFKDGRIKYPNLELAVHAAKLARKYRDEPAPKLVDRLVEASTKRTKEERKAGPSELGGLGESVLKAIRIYRGEDPERVLGAPKTRSFANNLIYPDQATTVTMDEHMARAMLGKGRENYSKSTEGVFNEMADGSGYTWSANLVKRLAKDKGVLPHQAQAVVWVAQKQIAEEMEAAAKAAKA